MVGSSKISNRRRSAKADGGPEYAAKRDELVRIAARLFKQQGFSKTRLIDIANAAGLDRATVYYYVGSKEELLQEAIEGMLASNLASAQIYAADDNLTVKEKLTAIVEVLMVSYEEHYPQMYVYIEEQMHQVAQQESTWAKLIMQETRDFEKIVRQLLQDGIESGELRGDVSARLASNALFGMFNWTHRWFTPDGPLNAREIAAAFAAIFFDGFVAQAATPVVAKSPKIRRA
jgi:AcrR family transcriptional regulator